MVFKKAQTELLTGGEPGEGRDAFVQRTLSTGNRLLNGKIFGKFAMLWRKMCRVRCFRKYQKC